MIIFPPDLRNGRKFASSVLICAKLGCRSTPLSKASANCPYDRAFQPSWPLPVGVAVELMNDGVASFASCFSSATMSAEIVAVYRVAGIDGGVAEQCHLGAREQNAAQIALNHDLRIELVGDEARPVERGRAGEDPVEVVWMQLCEFVALPPAGGETVPVRVFRGLAVVGLRDLFRLHGHFMDAALREVVPQDRVDASVRVHRERAAAGPALPGVRVR